MCNENYNNYHFNLGFPRSSEPQDEKKLNSNHCNALPSDYNSFIPSCTFYYLLKSTLRTITVTNVSAGTTPTATGRCHPVATVDTAITS